MQGRTQGCRRREDVRIYGRTVTTDNDGPGFIFGNRRSGWWGPSSRWYTNIHGTPFRWDERRRWIPVSYMRSRRTNTDDDDFRWNMRGRFPRVVSRTVRVDS